MKTSSATPKMVLLALAVTMTFSLAPQIARAQRCPASNLYYIVRDAKGAPVDPAKAGLSFEKNSGSTELDRDWRINSSGLAEGPTANVPPKILAQVTQAGTLLTSEWCVFKNPVKLQLTLNGKTMQLFFRTPKVADTANGTVQFLVDSIAFKPGKFEIELPFPKDRGEYSTVFFYPARGWKPAKK